MVVLGLGDILVLFILGVMAVVLLGVFMKEVLLGFWKSVKRLFGHE